MLSQPKLYHFTLTSDGYDRQIPGLGNRPIPSTSFARYFIALDVASAWAQLAAFIATADPDQWPVIHQVRLEGYKDIRDVAIEDHEVSYVTAIAALHGPKGLRGLE